MIKPKVTLALFLLVFISVWGCSKVMPTGNKPSVPDDHNIKLGTALHMPGYDKPLDLEKGCSNKYCHGEALEGGITVVDEVPYLAPSCYQCHDDKWNEHDH